MPDVLDGTSAAPADGPLHRRTFLAAAGVGALAVAGAAPVARAATGRTPVRVATVVLNGRVFTGTNGSTRAQAVAVGSDGKVLVVGNNADIRRRIGPRTVVIDADGATVMPGIQDGHMHPLGAAAQSLNPSLGNASMPVPQFSARLQEMLDATAAQEPDGRQRYAHAIGDRAARTALNAYEAVARPGRRSRRHTITHLQLVHRDRLPALRPRRSGGRHAVAVGAALLVHERRAAALCRAGAVHARVPGPQPGQGGGLAGRWLGLAVRPAASLHPDRHRDRPQQPRGEPAASQRPRRADPVPVAGHAHRGRGAPTA